ncbi:MAG: riboflavin synthase [Lachnospiraceae bacterium]|nr:riboflavin synthase [Lachnospiraceae bacterium]
MFTGIVEERGAIRRLEIRGHSGVLTVGCKKVLEGTKIGDSISVNGICLTVTNLYEDAFTADVMAETIRRSSLSGAAAGDPVNLERAMPADGRFGGHIVSGHIDGTGQVVRIRREENAVWFTIGTTPAMMRYIVEKGSICIDGISLTVAAVGEGTFSVSIIPHTMEMTTLAVRKPGSTVNLENDIVGKYVEKLVAAKDEGEGITLDFLQENGF